jgi:hypothetical protein
MAAGDYKTIKDEWEDYRATVLANVPADVMDDFFYTFYAGWKSAIHLLMAVRSEAEYHRLVDEMDAHTAQVRALAEREAML